MGKRYKAVLDYLEIENIGIDAGEDVPKDFDRAIIATPTDSHAMWCLEMIRRKKDFLCEKPLSRSLESIDNIIKQAKKKKVDGRMVCNWAFVRDEFKPIRSAKHISYDCYNTGNDGFEWDLIQLIYLADGSGSMYFDNNSPIFHCSIDFHKINRQDIDVSYVRMIDNWIKNKKLLWSLEDAREATKKVLKYMEIHGNSDTNSG